MVFAANNHILLERGCGNGKHPLSYKAIGISAEVVDADPLAVPTARSAGLAVSLRDVAEL